MKTVLIHPAFHKTGTTYLQYGLFADAAQFCQPWSRAFIEAHLIKPHPLRFNAENARALFQKQTDMTPTSVITVLSEEGLGGNPHYGAREAGTTAAKLKAVFGEAKILFTIRRQPDMLRSLYIQYLKEGGKHSASNFFLPKLYSEFFAFDPEVFAYHHIVNHYAGFFGASNIIVLPQEYLKHDEAGFIAALGRFLGQTLRPAVEKQHDVVRNISPPESSIPFMRLGNHFYKGPLNEPGFINTSLLGNVFRSLGYNQRLLFKGEGARLRALIQTQFSGHYAQSNAELQKYVPVSLKDYQYELPQ